MKRLLFTLPLVSFFSISFKAQNTDKNWVSDYKSEKVFIENKGQFHIQKSNEPVLFAVDHASESIFFTAKGVTYTFLKTRRPLKDKKELEYERKKGFKTKQEFEKFEKEERSLEYESQIVHFNWENANPNVEVSGTEVSESYYSYSFKDFNGLYKNENYIRAYKKINYKNIYPGIDVEYIFHPVTGLKYSYIIHPGADISLIKVKCSEASTLKKNGDILVVTNFGEIIEHSPSTFYLDNNSSKINSKFIKNGRIISIELENYNHSKTLVIDPWVQSPTFGTTTWHCVWECEKDGAGNVYIIGGGVSQTAGSQMRLLKYASTGGAPIWTYVTPYDTSNVWLGTFATDDIGNSYVTAGSVAQIEKINTAGGLVWNNANPGGIFSSAEFWNIVFNCDQSKLVIGGTGGSLFGLRAYIYDVDVNTGNITTSVSVAVGPMTTIPPNLQEVRSISSCPNGKYYFMTQDTIGFINQNFSLCPSGTSTLTKINNGIDFGYKCENYRFDNSGIMSVRADANFLYVNKGDQIQKRSLATLAVLATATIPGGALTTVFLGGKQVSNSGIDVDDCGNVYVGSTSGVVKFNSNLTQLATYSTTFNVYDVHVSTSGDIIACGSTGNSSSANRTGSIQSFAAAACLPIAITCCDATICQPATFCLGDPAVNLTASTAGGVFSGIGITNTALGTFNPSVSGVGIFTIKYTLACGVDSIIVKVNACNVLPACTNSPAGTITVSGGSGTYTWYHQVSSPGPCVPGAGFVCGFFTVAGPNVTTWQSYQTGSTMLPGATYPIYIIDATGDSVYIASFASLPACTNCVMTASVTAQANVTCNGANNGSASVAQTGGSGAITYLWSPGGITSATATSLSAQVYTVTITASGCTVAINVTITEASAITTATTSVNATCGSANGSATVIASGGTGALTYSWNPGGQTGSTATNLTANSYTCTIADASACTQTVVVNVNTNGGPTVSLASQTNVTCSGGSNGSATITATGGTGTLVYNWLPSGGTAITANGLGANTYTCTVTDGAGCVQSQIVNITSPASIITATTSVNATCGTANGSATVIASGGTGALTYSWNPGGQTGSTATNLTANSYTCTIADASACTQTVSVIVSNTGGPVASASANGPICSGTTLLLTSSGGVSSSWLGPNSFSSSITNPTIPFSTTLASGTYTVTVTDAGGCTNSTTVIVLVAASPIATASSVSSPICAGGTLSLTASGGTSYSWAGPNSYSNSTQNPTIINATTAESGTYTVTVTTGTCSATATVSVIVNALPISTATSNGPVCAGSTINLIGGGGGAYLWTGPNSFTSPSASPTLLNATSANSGTYTLTVTSVTNCSSTATVNVLVGVVTSQTVSASFCQGLNFTLPGGTQVATAGSYVDTIPSFAGCDSIVTINLTMNVNPTVTIGVSLNDTIYVTQSATLTATGGSTYVWSNGSTSASIVFVPAAIGSYTICVLGTNSFSCVDSQCVNIYVKQLDCGDLLVPSAFSPNGDNANDFLCIYGGGLNCIKVLQFRIYDRWGERVFETTEPNFCWDGVYKGHALNSAVFAYTLIATMIDDTEITRHGNISIVK